MFNDKTDSYAQALSRLIADPATGYRLRQRIKDDPLLNPPPGGAVLQRTDRELLERLDDLRRQDVLTRNEPLPSLSIHTLDQPEA